MRFAERANGKSLKRYLAGLIMLLPLSLGRDEFAAIQTTMHHSALAVT
ncbi:hypothetical protein LSUCC0031_13800 [Rhodobacterales bacterium LSUCC0031]|nr:hypothetical protein [Rhodobacterales bacterium LSUCC0031]